MDASQFLTILVSLFAIVNPIGSVPVFTTLTSGFTRREKLQVIRNAVLVGGGVLLAFALIGEFVFTVFGITIPAFRIAGGLLIGKYAFELLRGERPKEDSNDAEIKDAVERAGIGITPLGVPLLTGPGAITTVMLVVSGLSAPTDRALVFLAALLVFGAAFLILAASDRLLALLGRSGLMIFTRLMGLLLAAVAVQFVLTGLKQLAPALFIGGA